MLRSPRRHPLRGLSLAGALGVVAAALGTLPLHAAGAQQQWASSDTTATAPAGEGATATGGRHSVRRGDTLWDLSASYLGNPYRWPEIDKANKDQIRDPHWIYPGQRLRLPDGREITVGQEGRDTRDASRDRDVDVADDAADDGPTTVFARRGQRRDVHSSGWSAIPNRSLERVALGSAAEWYAAPFAVAHTAPKGPGEVLGTVEAAGSRASDRRAQLLDRIAVTAPAGAELQAGSALLIYTDGDDIGRGRVLLPTGIATIERVARKGVVVAKLTRMYNVVASGQHVMPLEAAPAELETASPRSATEAAALDTRVIWVEHGAKLPTIQTRVILDTRSRDDVQVGDVFSLYPSPRPVNGREMPEAAIANVRVLRVTPIGATAVVIGQDAPGIAPGVAARRYQP